MVVYPLNSNSRLNLSFQTGTLTEEGLDLWGVVPLSGNADRGRSGFGEPIREALQMSHGALMVGMAACHSLTRIDEDLIGDPLDLKVSPTFSRF